LANLIENRRRRQYRFGNLPEADTERHAGRQCGDDVMQPSHRWLIMVIGLPLSTIGLGSRHKACLPWDAGLFSVRRFFPLLSRCAVLPLRATELYGAAHVDPHVSINMSSP